MKFKDRPADLPDVTYKARYKEGDPVIIHFGTSGFITNCRVTKVHFGGSRIAYDVEVKWQHEWEHHEGMPEFMTARIHNLDYLRVFSPQDFEQLHPEDQLQKEANFVVRLKAHVEKKMKESGMLEKIQSVMSYDQTEDMFRLFSDSLCDGAVDALKVGGCVEKYIPKQKQS